MNLEDQRKFIKLAADLGYEYILIDALWDEKIGRVKMAELVKEAAALKVGVSCFGITPTARGTTPRRRRCMAWTPRRRGTGKWRGWSPSA